MWWRLPRGGLCRGRGKRLRPGPVSQHGSNGQGPRRAAGPLPSRCKRPCRVSPLRLRLLYETANRTLLSRAGIIWVMEYILKKIPVHSHDWKMFIQPQELNKALEQHGLENMELRGLSIKHGIKGFIYRYITGKDPWIFEISDDKRISYLGYAIKRNPPLFSAQ